ncbi:glycosyltransferase family 4 protein [Bacillus marinisedimentorum]|uniref:glycosyltransferase family 4 protein n=1 Tax=Bacillus marinisedimentorum TaxID=1821260 RepID=UPI0007E09596|nr:glycosyltransferase family 4 protein [Bacillus marinisedimentorum]
MRIIYISWFNSGEGSQVHAKEFMNAMRNLGHQVIPVELSLRSSKQLDQKNQTNKNSPPRRNLLTELKSIAMNIPRFFRLMKIIRAEKPDAIINRYAIYDLSPLLAKLFNNIPIIYEVNASAVYEREIKNMYLIKPFAKFVEKRIFAKADATLVVSEELKKYFTKQGYDMENTVVTPNGVDFESFSAMNEIPPEIEKIKEEWNDKIVVGFLGSLKTWHGVERVIDIMPDIIAVNKNIRFLVIGGGEERKKLEQKISDLKLQKYVYISGFLDYKYVPGSLKLFDFAVAPYHNIDFFHFSPLKIFEYMAAGAPVIAPPYGQISELVINQYNGLIMSNNSNDELFDAINYLADHPDKRETLGTNAQQFIKENYSWKINAKKIEDIVIDLHSHS